MDQEKQKKERTWPYYLLAFIIVLALSILGTVLFAKRIPEGIAKILGGVLIGILVIWYLGSAIYQRKSEKTRADQKEISERLRIWCDGGDEVLTLLERKLDRACRLSNIVMTCLWLWGICVSLLLYVMPGVAIFPLSVVGCLLLRCMQKEESPGELGVIDKTVYADLYALAEKAQATVGGNRRIRIVLEASCQAGVALYPQEVRLILGVVVLQCFSRDEIYQVLLHEFAHLINDQQLYYKRRCDRFGKGGLLFSVTDSLEAEAYAYYQIFMSRKLEEQADKIILEKGDPQAAANSFAKLRCYDNYSHDFLKTDVRIIQFMPEETPKNWVSFLCDDFRKAVENNEAFARELINKELRPKVSSHPIARERIEALGVTDFSLEFPRHEGSWAKMCEAALEWADQYFFDTVSQNYEQNREEGYLKPLRCVAQWNETEQELTHENTREVLEAMCTLQEYEQIIRLSEAYAATGASESERCHALFYEGISRLQLRDQSGIECLYRAATVNSNYLDSAMDIISNYCLTLGLEDEMERYRKFVREVEDDYLDHVNVFPLSARDNLVVSDLEEILRDENLNMIRMTGGEVLEAVFLVKKILSGNNSKHIYILKFREGTDETVQEQVRERVFIHLDKQEENYALTVWKTSYTWLNKRSEYKIL